MINVGLTQVSSIKSPTSYNIYKKDKTINGRFSADICSQQVESVTVVSYPSHTFPGKNHWRQVTST